MAERITQADIAVQAALLATYSEAAGIIATGDRLHVQKGMGTYNLHVIPAGESNRSHFPGTSGFGIIGASAREAFRFLNTAQETMRATLDALGVEYTYPTEAVAAIRGER